MRYFRRILLAVTGILVVAGAMCLIFLLPVLFIRPARRPDQDRQSAGDREGMISPVGQTADKPAASHRSMLNAAARKALQQVSML